MRIIASGTIHAVARRQEQDPHQGPAPGWVCTGAAIDLWLGQLVARLIWSLEIIISTCLKNVQLIATNLINKLHFQLTGTNT